MKQISHKQSKDIIEKLPSLQNLIEGGQSEYQVLFVSVFDHWLTPAELATEIHPEDKKKLSLRRASLERFIVDLYNITQCYTWKYKRKNRFSFIVLKH